MYLSPQTLLDLERKYGRPAVRLFRYAMHDREFCMLLGSMHHNRRHDVTLFIQEGGRFVCISKHAYPPGGYRAPSGGIKPGETFEEGALREAYEETGLRVRLDRYVLRSHVTFVHDGREEPWTTHVFTATATGGRLEAVDRHEIQEVRLLTPEEMATTVRSALLSRDSGGLRYRVALTDAVLAELGFRAELADPAP